MASFRIRKTQRIGNATYVESYTPAEWILYNAIVLPFKIWYYLIKWGLQFTIFSLKHLFVFIKWISKITYDYIKSVRERKDLQFQEVKA
jgi:hypothetical protein